jgi:hypothetical protein
VKVGIETVNTTMEYEARFITFVLDGGCLLVQEFDDDMTEASSWTLFSEGEWKSFWQIERPSTATCDEFRRARIRTQLAERYIADEISAEMSKSHSTAYQSPNNTHI